MRKELYKILISVIITLSLLILFKKNNQFKEQFYTKVYEENISFAYLNNLYNKYLGSLFDINTLPVFNEKINYSEKEEYKEGVKLKLYNPLIASLEEGLVTFIGEKEDYGKTIIIEDINGVETYYSNLEEVSISLYDYVNKGNLIASSNELVLVFKKDGNILNYEEYLP